MTSWTEALKLNIAWWAREDAKMDEHVLPYFEDRKTILETNPRFQLATLQALNTHVITSNSQDGLNESVDTEIHPVFVKQEINAKRIPGNFPTEGVVGRECQRPYMEFIATREQAVYLDKALTKRALFISDLKERTINANAELDMKKTGDRLQVTKVEMKKDNLSTTTYPTGLYAAGLLEIENYLEPLAKDDHANLVHVTVASLDYGENGDSFLKEIVTALETFTKVQVKGT